MRTSHPRLHPLVLVVGLLLAAASPSRSEDVLAANADPESLEAEGSWLGILFGDATDGGVQVLAVVPGGPAAVGGLREGDLIVRIGERDTPDRSALEQAVVGLRPEIPAGVTIIRAGRSLRAVVVPAERGAASWLERWPDPPAIPQRPAPPVARVPRGLPAWLGIEFSQVPADLLQHLGAPRDRGVLVVRVDPGGPAARAGIRVGDVLVRLGGRVLRRPEDTLAALASDLRQPLPFEGVRSGQAVSGRLNLPTAGDPKTFERARLEAERARLLEEIERIDRALREIGPEP